MSDDRPSAFTWTLATRWPVKQICITPKIKGDRFIRSDRTTQQKRRLALILCTQFPIEAQVSGQRIKDINFGTVEEEVRHDEEGGLRKEGEIM